MVAESKEFGFDYEELTICQFCVHQPLPVCMGGQYIGDTVCQDGKDDYTCYTPLGNRAEGYYNRGIINRRLGRYAESEDDYRLAVALKPNFYQAWNNLGNLQKDFGRLDEAEKCYRKAITIKPDFWMGRSNLLLTMNYSSDHTPEEIAESHKEFGKMAMGTAKEEVWQR